MSKVDLRAVNSAQFKTAKRLWGASLLFKVGMFGLASATIVYPLGDYVPQALLVLALLSEALQIRSDHVKGSAESVLRTLDLCRSFNREISSADHRDIVLAAPRKLREPLRDAMLPADTYFASNEVAGPRRSVDSLYESAWYTRQQAIWMTTLYAVLIILLVFLSIAALVIASRDITAPADRESVVRVVTGALMLLVSLGMYKSPLGYYRLQRRCSKTEATCRSLLANKKILEADAQKQWFEYQLSRSCAPLLPEWLWKLRGDRLDKAWKAQVA